MTRSPDTDRKGDVAAYKKLHPDGEAKTIRVGFMQTPFWRCRPVKGFGPWQALPHYPQQDPSRPPPIPPPAPPPIPVRSLSISSRA